MSIKEEIRNYQSKEEVEKDYERYKEEWRYNVERMVKSGHIYECLKTNLL